MTNALPQLMVNTFKIKIKIYSTGKIHGFKAAGNNFKKRVVKMELEYFYCGHCGYEVFDTFIAYSRTCASGDLYCCPICREEN